MSSTGEVLKKQLRITVSRFGRSLWSAISRVQREWFKVKYCCFYDIFQSNEISTRWGRRPRRGETVLTTRPITSYRHPMVNMETWIPAQLDTMPLFNSHDVKECGSIAPPGHFGWFVPVSLSRFDDNWATFAKRETAARFDVDEITLDNVRNFTVDPATRAHYCQESFCHDGMYIPERCRGEPCALLFAGFGNVTDFVRDHIDRMKLYVKVIWVGPELKHVTETLTENLTLLNSAAPAGNRYLAHFFVHALVFGLVFLFLRRYEYALWHESWEAV